LPPICPRIIDKQTALRLARRHDQLAFVYGTAGEPAEIIWTGEIQKMA